MRRSPPKGYADTAARSLNDVPRCAHRTRITRVDATGRYLMRCLDCKRESVPHETVRDVSLHWREDLDGAVETGIGRGYR